MTASGRKQACNFYMNNGLEMHLSKLISIYTPKQNEA